MNIFIGILQIVIWALGVMLFIAFIYACLKAYALLYDYSGKTYAYIFMFGMFGFVCNNRNDDTSTHKDGSKEVLYVPKDFQEGYNSINSVDKELDVYGFNKTKLYVTFGKKENSKPVLLRSWLSFSGFGINKQGTTYNLTAVSNSDSTVYTIGYHASVERHLSVIGAMGINNTKTVFDNFTVNVDSLFKADR
jgi:hypothetical protein